jgi:hypothetical protein
VILPRARPVVLAALLSAGLAAGAPASLEPAAIRVTTAKGRAVAAEDLTGVFGPGRQREFGNGLTNVVEIYTAVIPTGGGGPVSINGRIVEILFDVWEETYAVVVKDANHPAGRRYALQSFDALRAFLVDQRDVDLGPVTALPDVFRVEIRVEVNPVSKEQLQRTREYIAAASGSSRPAGSRSVLGAVASFLLREPDAGSDVHVFRSDPFTRSGLGAR